MLFGEGSSFMPFFPLRGLTSENFWQLPWYAQVLDYARHIALPILAMALGAFATSTLLTKNSFLDEIRKQYVLTARMKGLSERQVLYGHVFRNAMLIVIAGFPGAFIHAFFTGSLLIETVFSLDGLGLLAFEIDREPRLRRGVREALHLLAARPRREPAVGSHLHVDRPPHRFRDAGGVSMDRSPTPASRRRAPPDGRTARAALAAQGLFRLSPMNERRLANFRANRRGYWSFWIFMVLFVLCLFAEFLANDRPILVRYKGEILMPVFVNYPEEKFGGFLAQTDYRDPCHRKEIEENGWAIWPPIHFASNTINLDLPTAAPSPPTWRLPESVCKPVAEKRGFPAATASCRDLEWNWLGTDDGGRDVLARVIYGFRISVLFGLILAGISSVIGILAGAVQGYFGGKVDLYFQRIIEIWSAIPSLYLLMILSNFFQPSFFTLLGILLLFSWVALVHVVRAEFLRARNFDYVRAARALGLSTPRSWSSTCFPTRWSRHDLPALHPQRLHHHADIARFPRLRPAARLAVAGGTAAPGQEQHLRALARPDGLLRHRPHALAADLHRRSGARCVRSQEDVRVREGCVMVRDTELTP